MNQKFILIGLLLGACFAFTALQAATGEAQQCDPGPACIENCCGQCDPNPACVENCCPAGDPNAPANVTLDPNIDPRSPAPSGNATLDPNIDPQQNKIPNMKGIDLGTAKHAPNPKVKQNMKGIDLGTSEDTAARNVIPNVQGQVQVQEDDPNRETEALQGQWISCGSMRADIAGRLETVTSNLNEFPGSIRGAGCGPAPQYQECVQTHFSPGWPWGNLMNGIHDKIREIHDYIDARC